MKNNKIDHGQTQNTVNDGKKKMEDNEEKIVDNNDNHNGCAEESEGMHCEEDKKIKELTEKLKEAEEKMKTYNLKNGEVNDKYLRLAAEFDTFRRRTSKERLELINTASEEIIKGLLPILDDCQRALQVLKDSKDTEAAKEGTELILNKLFAYLKSKGLSVIEAIGKELDTDFHEAVAQMPIDDKDKKNKIIDIVQEGYTLNGKVIRYAKVVVGI